MSRCVNRWVVEVTLAPGHGAVTRAGAVQRWALALGIGRPSTRLVSRKDRNGEHSQGAPGR